MSSSMRCRSGVIAASSAPSATRALLSVPGIGMAVSRNGRSPLGSMPAESPTSGVTFFVGAGGSPG